MRFVDRRSRLAGAGQSARVAAARGDVRRPRATAQCVCETGVCKVLQHWRQSRKCRSVGVAVLSGCAQPALFNAMLPVTYRCFPLIFASDLLHTVVKGKPLWLLWIGRYTCGDLRCWYTHRHRYATAPHVRTAAGGLRRRSQRTRVEHARASQVESVGAHDAAGVLQGRGQRARRARPNRPRDDVFHLCVAVGDAWVSVRGRWFSKLSFCSLCSSDDYECWATYVLMTESAYAKQ
jgi:hypothetical protein